MATIPNPWLTYSEAVNSHALDAGAAPDDPGRSAAPVPIEPSMTMEVNEEASAAAAASKPTTADATDPDRNCDSWDINAVDQIHEIFFHARKLLAEDTHRAANFVDLDALEAALDEPLPLFLRDDGYLRRRA